MATAGGVVINGKRYDDGQFQGLNTDGIAKMKAAIDAAAKAIQAIPQPFRNNINSKEAAEAMEACAELGDILENELKPFLANSTK